MNTTEIEGIRPLSEAPRSMLSWKNVWHLIRRTVAEFQDDRCAQMASAIAFNVLFAIIPLVALLVAALGMVMRIPGVADRVVERILAWLPLRSGPGENLVTDTIRAVSHASEPLSIVAALGLLWTSIGLLGSVRDALNVAWDVTHYRSYFRQKLFDLGSLVGLGLLLGGSLLVTAVLHVLRSTGDVLLGPHAHHLSPLWSLVAWLFPPLVTFVAFLLLYRYLPRVRHEVREVWPGAVLAAVLFEGAKHLFTVYVAHFARYEAVYGTLGAVMLFLMWIYVSSLILLLGAEFASVYEHMLRAHEGRGDDFVAARTHEAPP